MSKYLSSAWPSLNLHIGRKDDAQLGRSLLKTYWFLAAMARNARPVADELAALAVLAIGPWRKDATRMHVEATSAEKNRSFILQLSRSKAFKIKIVKQT